MTIVIATPEMLALHEGVKFIISHPWSLFQTIQIFLESYKPNAIFHFLCITQSKPYKYVPQDDHVGNHFFHQVSLSLNLAIISVHVKILL